MKEKINFSEPCFMGNEKRYLNEVMSGVKLSGDGKFTFKCHDWIERELQVEKAYLVTSGTHALEMAAILCGVKAGDEVIMPSYTFPSTANAFVLRGATPVFVDIRPDTMNIDEKLIESAITERTKAIVPVHYAGVACNMDEICRIASKYGLLVIEDAAQAFYSKYKGKSLGTIGDIGIYSFHDTKNITSGEGGCLLVNNSKYIHAAEILREKGTNRSQFFKGEVDKYSWIDVGSSYLPSEINAAVLFGQLQNADIIHEKRMLIWKQYSDGLRGLMHKIDFPHIEKICRHNAHIFYIKCSLKSERGRLLKFLINKDIHASFHYVPLHTSPAGIKYSRFHGKDIYTTIESDRIVRLPLHSNMSVSDARKVISAVYEFYQDK